jgi:hypothetical protein
MANKLNFTPSTTIQGKFEVINTSDPILHSRIGVIDFRLISEAQAEQLVKAGTRYLKKLKVKPKKQI